MRVILPRVLRAVHGYDDQYRATQAQFKEKRGSTKDTTFILGQKRNHITQNMGLDNARTLSRHNVISNLVLSQARFEAAGKQ